MLNVEMDDGWNSDEEEEEEEEETGEEEGSEEEGEKEPEVALSRKDRKKLYHLKVRTRRGGEA